MKRFICCAAALCLLLAGCSKPAPAKAADGTDWSGDWVSIGNVLGVEEPGHSLELRDNNEALSVNDMYLASWTAGEGLPYVNEDGDDVLLYPARLDVLVYGRRDADAAKQAVEDWTARLAETYDVVSNREETHNSQDFTVSAYTCKSDSNPYARGIAAFGVYQDYAISAELNCLDSFDGDEAEILQDFLDVCHYAA